jgi:predicted ribosome quality control (RQC) complex YloA/Tae2 family protein
MPFNLECIYMMSNTEDPALLAQWQQIENSVKILDQEQVTQLFAHQYGTFEEFQRALSEALSAKIASLEKKTSELRKDRMKMEAKIKKLDKKAARLERKLGKNSS